MANVSIQEIMDRYENEIKSLYRRAIIAEAQAAALLNELNQHTESSDLTTLEEHTVE